MVKRAILIALLSAGSAASADSWDPPSTEIYTSQDGNARLMVIPGDLDSIAYLAGEVEGREQSDVPARSTQTSAIAALELLNPAGRWEAAWRKALTNEAAPVLVVIANDGNGFATFDDWASMGYGPNAIAIYAGDGTLVRQFELENLFPDWFVAALPQSVSSIHWRGNPRIAGDGTEVIVPIVLPTDDKHSLGEGRKIDLTFRFADGSPVGLERKEWKKALNDAAVVARARCAAEREWIRAWNAPITAPTSSKQEDWHHFLSESQFRTKWSDDLINPRPTVLRLASAIDFQASVAWLEEALTESARSDHDLRAIGSPDLGRLMIEIERIGPSIQPGQLTGVDLVIVADTLHSSRIHAALVHSGATLELIDPTRSFPQIERRVMHQAEPVTCRAPAPGANNVAWWHALPFLALGGTILLLRRA
jgi:hypothetical protein